jgi:hypothetical protein
MRFRSIERTLVVVNCLICRQQGMMELDTEGFYYTRGSLRSSWFVLHIPRVRKVLSA